jgi:hypothetical protein
MVDNSAIRGDEKNQKNKKEDSGFSDPSVGDTITLHDAAVALAAVAPAKKGEKISDGKLLRELKTGRVQAGFHCSSDPLIWVSIPREYWVGVATDAFHRVRYSPRKENRTGAYKVTLKDFPKQYMSACIQVATDTNQKLNPEWIVEAFDAAIAGIKSPFEVEIPKESWDKYLATQMAIKSSSDVEIAPETDSGSGRKAYSGWKALNAMLAAYLVANNIRSDEDQKIEAVAANVLELAINLNEQTKLPTQKTFEKEVSRVFGLIEKLQKK